MNAQYIKGKIKEKFSTTAAIIKAAKDRRYFASKYGPRRRAVKRMLFGEKPPSIVYGPFRGMKYIDETVFGEIEPRWIGSYEEELHEIIYGLINRAYDTIVDVGSAEGYYAVGMGRASKVSQVFSYDVDPRARLQQKRLAALNGVTNLTIRSSCRDCEGYEYELLDPAVVDGLRLADILAEVHSYKNMPYNEVAKTITDRFKHTHEITWIREHERDAEFYFSLCCKKIPISLLREILDEGRQEQAWVLMRTRYPYRG